MSGNMLLLAPGFLEQAELLPKPAKAKLVKCLRFLSIDHTHPGLQAKTIKGARGVLYECRVDRDVRLIYDRKDIHLRCWWVGSHDDALRRAERGDIHVDDVEFSSQLFGSPAITHYLGTGEIPRDLQEWQCNALDKRLLEA